MNLIELQKKIRKTRRSLDKIHARSMRENKEEIIDMNQAQLTRGVDANNELLPEYASPEYAELKAAMGSRSSGHYDLKLEGDFYSGFFAKLEKFDLVIDSQDEKRDKLVSLTSPQPIFGLNEKNMDELRWEYYYPSFIEKLKRSLEIET